MKFTKLARKFEKLVEKQKQSKKIRPEKLQTLQQLLVDKKSRYEKKLKSTKDPKERKKLKTKLKVVDAQIKKSKRLLSGG